MLTRLQDRFGPVTTPGLFSIGVVVLAVAMLWLGWLPVLAIAVVVPTAIACYKRPQRGILLLLALLPFHGLLLLTGKPPGSIVYSWKDVAQGALLVLTFVCPKEARAPAGRKLPTWVWPMVGLLGVGLISAGFVSRTQALVGLKIYFWPITIAWACWRCPLNARERDHLVSIFMGVGIITSLVGLWQQVVGQTYLFNLGYQYGDSIRTTGDHLRSFSTFVQPFPFALYLMLVVLIGLPAALSEPHRLRSKIFFLSLPLLGAGIVSSFVRQAILGLAVGFAYLALHRYKVLVYVVPFAIIGLLLLPGGSITGALTGSSSLNERTSGWSQNFHLIITHPLGQGIGSVGSAADRVAGIKFGQNNDVNTYEPDSSYFAAAFDLGIAGLWFRVLWMIAAYACARDAERRSRGRTADFAASIAAVMLAVLAAALVTDYFGVVPVDIIYWMLIAIVATLPWQAEEEDEEAPERARRAGGLAAGRAVALGRSR